MLPEEDRGAAWLRDYGAVEADIEALAEFAAALADEVEQGYLPHLRTVTEAMMTTIPAGHPHFPELKAFLEHHHGAQQAAYANTFNFRAGTAHAAEAARKISEEYRGADAFARARVEDVRDAFGWAWTDKVRP